MKLRCFFLFFISFLLFISEKLVAQLNEADSLVYQSALANAVHLYYAKTGDQLLLYNGPMYRGYAYRFRDGSPFFNVEKPDTGSVYYDEKFYEKILLLYNNLDDILLADDNGYLIQLNEKKIKSFTLAGSYHFIRIEKNDINNNTPTGFYEILYTGYIDVLKKTIKKINEDLSNGHDIQHYITSEDHYYIKKNNAFFPIDNKNEVADLFPEKKKEILKFFKKNKLNFRKDKENALIQFDSHYQEIIQ